jgi:hypothetical protein
MHKELTIAELEMQGAELLPEREALGVFNWAGVSATNVAVALNAGSLFSAASATALQGISVTQS